MAKQQMDVSGMPLAQAYTLLKGPETSYDDLDRAIDGRVASATLQRLGDPKRPFNQPVLPTTLIGAAEAINAATPRKTTPWALWIAHGIQFEQTHGLWGRAQAERSASAAHLLPPGWPDLTDQRFAVWHSVGQSLLDEQHTTSEIERLRAVIAERDATIERLTEASRRG